MDDPFLFAKVVCRHADLSEASHKPLVYMAAGCVDKLIAILGDNKQRSYVVEHIRTVLRQFGIDWWTPEGRQKLIDKLRFINIRVFRGAAKSSCITHAVTLWRATRDADESIVVICNTEDKVIERIKQIRATILSDSYKALFPERVPEDTIKLLTEKRLTLAGRTKPDQEPSIMGLSAEGSEQGYHFDTFVVDDLVGEKNATPVGIAAANSFLGNLTGMYNPGIHRPIRRVHVGTRYDEEDDDKSLREAGALSISVPIEVHDEPPEDIRLRGTPTMPEWKNVQQIDEIQAATLLNPAQGAWWWRANFLLNPLAGNARIFPAHIVENAYWERFKHDVEPKRWWIGRPLWDSGKRVRDAEGNAKYRKVDPGALYRVIGVDQSTSDEGDEWCVCVLGMDTDGFMYVLETVAGHGYEYMLDGILILDDKWKVQRIGIEGGGMQDSTHFWMRKTPRFRKLKSRITEIRPGQRAKQIKIHNQVADPMRMHQLFIPTPEFSADAVALCEEMKAYRPGPKARDNRIDAVAIATMTLRVPTEESKISRDIERYERMRDRAVDPRTGIYLG